MSQKTRRPYWQYWNDDDAEDENDYVKNLDYIPEDKKAILAANDDFTLVDCST